MEVQLDTTKAVVTTTTTTTNHSANTKSIQMMSSTPTTTTATNHNHHHHHHSNNHIYVMVMQQLNIEIQIMLSFLRNYGSNNNNSSSSSYYNGTTTANNNSNSSIIARGSDLVQEFIDLRNYIQRIIVSSSSISSSSSSVNNASSSTAIAATTDVATAATDATVATTTTTTSESGEVVSSSSSSNDTTTIPTHSSTTTTNNTTTNTHNNNNNNSNNSSTIYYIRPFLHVITDPRASGIHTLMALRSILRLLKCTISSISSSSSNTNTTTISILQYLHITGTEMMIQILNCKYEQTHPIYDEAVEMTIADVLLYIIVHYNNNHTMYNVDSSIIIPNNNTILFDAFNTIFVTRHTFLHTSIAIMDHIEDVLYNILSYIFTKENNNSSSIETTTTTTTASALIMDFLVNQLLHTPLVFGNHGGSNSNNSGGTSTGGGTIDIGGGSNNNSNDIMMTSNNHHLVRQAHDDTRMICLRLIRRALQTFQQPIGYMNNNNNILLLKGIVAVDDTNDTSRNHHHNNNHHRSLLSIIQDDLCLSLLLTGQAIWAGNITTNMINNNNNISIVSSIVPGFVSLDVLSEICHVLATLWNTISLRTVLISQFETIWTGFYTRALVLLRKRPQPSSIGSNNNNTSSTNHHHAAAIYHANAIFDAEVEIILESLVDLLCYHDHTQTIADHHDGDGNGGGGTIETLFTLYDCHLRRANVATGLLVELCRCCGGTIIDTDGHLASSSGALISNITTPLRNNSKSELDHNFGNSTTTAPTNTSTTPQQSSDTTMKYNIANNISNDDDDDDTMQEQALQYPVRSVPAHLKELCAKALMGGMKCLFLDDHASPEKLRERIQRKRSIMVVQQQEQQIDDPTTTIGIDDNTVEDENYSNMERNNNRHVLRDLKSKKRLLAKAARIFNKKASRGIEFLVDAGLVAEPITPASVASFLRNGIVVGLDKRAIGAYLGEAGKSPMAGKSPPLWERDWFHKDVLRIYCTLFRFEDQTLLDGLRMFLATFRLPGEAQQIDRILQAFSDTCSQVCEECKLGIFSSDPKRASDAAYLLSFSIIMLNTDRHNKNIREDRKMSCDDFYKNNYDYGRDITEKGKEFPREYLTSIYESINDEELRTEGEGADGAMTVERWKDVLRGFSDDEVEDIMPSPTDADDVTELVIEHVWRPIISAIGALWNVHASRSKYLDAPTKPAEGSLLGVQGGRLGMDMANEMLNGVCQLGRIDIFRRLFMSICDFTGLLGEYTESTSKRAWVFSNSLESQAATIVAIRTAIESSENLDEECWKRVWAIIFELRDLKIFSVGKKKGSNRSNFHESDPDLLNERARFEWTMCLAKGDMDYWSRPSPDKSKEKGSTLLGAFGWVFGSPTPAVRDTATEETSFAERSIHGKEKLVIWDESALSDDEGDEDDDDKNNIPSPPAASIVDDYSSLGMQFEEMLVLENMEMNRQMDMPVTGLERMDETRSSRASPRARTRRRLRQACDLRTIISDSRFMDEAAIISVIKSLAGLVSSAITPTSFVLETAPLSARSFDRCSSDLSISSSTGGMNQLHVPISPASEALAEVLICELALKNKDRLKLLWSQVLQDHYLSCLTRLLVNPDEEHSTSTVVPVDPGLEKRVTGLLRLTECAVKRKDIANEILSAWKYVLPVNDVQHATSPLRVLYRQIGEGLWRIVVDVDSISTNLNADGWEGLVSLMGWCANRGSMMKPVLSIPDGSRDSGLSEDDPALQCYRTLHLLLSTKELDAKVPCSVLWSLRCLIAAGGRRNYAQLSVASLDLLDILHEKKLQCIKSSIQSSPVDDKSIPNNFWSTCWRNIMEGIAEAAELSVDTNIRQHALSILTDLFLKKQPIPIDQLCTVLSELCIPLAGRRIVKIQNPQKYINSNELMDVSITSTDLLMMEFELCIGLIFKPLRQHLPNIIGNGIESSISTSNNKHLSLLWTAVLSAMENLFSENSNMTPPGTVVDSDSDPAIDEYNHHQYEKNNNYVVSEELKLTMNSLAQEHLQTAIMVLLCELQRLQEESDGTGQQQQQQQETQLILNQIWNSIKKLKIATDIDIQNWIEQSKEIVQRKRTDSSSFRENTTIAAATTTSMES